MSKEQVVLVEDLGKKFKIYRQPWDRGREWLSFGARRYHDDFWALRGVSFSLGRGDALGLVGQNGAGKSTLLKILTGAMYPTEGRFTINGRVLSMLELGTGFHKELTGRQNVLQSGNLLNFSAGYIAERMADIEEFADIGDFFDRPLKIYSSGMRSRLAFAMFAFLDCDVLIIDEVLSVGDTFFVQKCYERLSRLQDQGTTIIMVTHNMSVIQQYCQQAIVLDHGRVVFAGPPPEAATFYFFQQRQPRALPRRPADPAPHAAPPPAPRPAPGLIAWPAPDSFGDISGLAGVGDGLARCTALALCDDDRRPCHFFRAGQRAHWFYEFEALTDFESPAGVLTIYNERNLRVHGKSTLHLGVRPPRHLRSGQRIRIHQSVALALAPGAYTFGVGLSASDPAAAEGPPGFLANNIVGAGSFQIIPPPGAHLGLCDLDGSCELEMV